MSYGLPSGMTAIHWTKKPKAEQGMCRNSYDIGTFPLPAIPGSEIENVYTPVIVVIAAQPFRHSNSAAGATMHRHPRPSQDHVRADCAGEAA